MNIKNTRRTLALLLAVIVLAGAIVATNWHVRRHNKAQFNATGGAGVEYIIDRKHNLCFAWVARFRKAGLTRVPCEALK